MPYILFISLSIILYFSPLGGADGVGGPETIRHSRNPFSWCSYFYIPFLKTNIDFLDLCCT